MTDGSPTTGPGRAVVPADPDLLPAAPRPAKHRGEQQQWVLRLADQVAAAGAELLSLAIPVECVCCGAEDRALCAPCERQVRILTSRPFRAEAQAPALMDVDGGVILPVVAAGVYREELAQALLSFKSHGQHQLKSVLAKGLGGAVTAAADGMDAVFLVPVPSSAGAFVKRGFSPVHLLLGALRGGGNLACTPVLDVLRKSPRRAVGEQLPGGQKGLGRGARAKRVRGSMRVAGWKQRSVAGRRCVIVDDVLTTGATLSESARALHLAGAFVAGAVVLAATRPPDSGASASPRRVLAEGTMT
ncbi:ComF family protein [Arthrobacter sp. ISL-48]|uniref:ComF family protein n=1 Tax=Arthrobacter sp. ISL-48 TaxID=2819110 RepID=UPI001BEA6B1C|nr:phosphoribosyltransferase family protein [Arthrobacter sp. ISL-48]MBT2531873.1 ComF family protein [Arthrobacter sp. ISL-48]